MEDNVSLLKSLLSQHYKVNQKITFLMTEQVVPNQLVLKLTSPNGDKVNLSFVNSEIDQIRDLI